MSVGEVHELWRDIKGYEGLYQVSNLGRVKKLRFINGKYNLKKELLKKPIMGQRYLYVRISKNGITKNRTIHRLVAETFIPNPNHLPEVNHIDGNRLNNKFDNLEWCTRSENTIHAIKTGLMKIKNGNDSPLSKSVLQYSKSGDLIKEWQCIKVASIHTKTNASNISMCCKGKRKTVGGYIWKYAD